MRSAFRTLIGVFVFEVLICLAQTPAPPARISNCSIQEATVAGQTVWLLCSQDQLLVTSDKGATWQARSLPPGPKPRTLAFLDARSGFVAGDSGMLLATADGGANWRKVTVPVEVHLTSLQFVGESGWIVGWNGVILHSGDGGRNWDRQNSGILQSLESVFFVDRENGWAVGWMGTMLRTSNGGGTWEQAKTAGMAWSLNSVHFRDKLNGCAVGFDGQILRTTDGGVNWQTVTSPVRAMLTSVLFDGAGRVWITADNDLVLSEDQGETWKLVTLDEQVFLRQVVTVGDALFAVGQFGVLRRDNPKAKWQRLDVFGDGSGTPSAPAPGARPGSV